MHLQKRYTARGFRNGAGQKAQKGLLFHRMPVSFYLTFLLSSPCDIGDKDDLFSPKIIQSRKINTGSATAGVAAQ